MSDKMTFSIILSGIELQACKLLALTIKDEIYCFNLEGAIYVTNTTSKKETKKQYLLKDKFYPRLTRI